MAPTRSVQTRTRVLLFVLLCIGVVMQMLGTPATLWTVDLDTDLVSASLLEGLSLPLDQFALVPLGSTRRQTDLSHHSRLILFQDMLLRPPSLQPSPRFLA